MYYIGVDIGGTNISAGAVSESGELLFKKSVKTGKERDYEDILKDIIALVNEIKNEGSDGAKSIGLGCPGSCNKNTGTVEFSGNLNWHNVPLAADVQRAAELPAFLENDANAAAYGEFVSGAAKGLNSAVIITLGTGVGAGIIIDKKVFCGENFAGGEIGHNVISVDGPPCTCGRSGCFEVFSSATGLIRMTDEIMQKNPNSAMHSITEEMGKISARTAFIAAKQGDEAGKKVVDDYIKYLACGIANVINTFQPDCLCIGGGVCNEGDYLLVPLRELVAREIYTRNSAKNTEIFTCKLGNDAGIIGAALANV
ncbi:MAG: ROK family protein [Oscillospiraceae bacterium]|jgi:glucokinase|nr:ROK family protein [Oscillospiraceae bacterium]